MEKVQQIIPCHFLRTKMFYVHRPTGITYLQKTRPTEHYWCTRSTGATGPDDQPVEPDICTSNRRCFSPRDLSALEV